jgi:hypothetical protein
VHLFSIATTSEVWNGEPTLFWTRPMASRKKPEIAPLLYAAITQRKRQKRTVQEALPGHVRASDIQGALTMGIIVEYTQVWDLLLEVQLQPEVDDTQGPLAASGQYSAKLSYDSLFVGATLFEPCERIWKSWVPPKCRIFLWLVADKRCWTADRLARRGLPHLDKCPLCHQEDENIDHLLVSCFLQGKFGICC